MFDYCKELKSSTIESFKGQLETASMSDSIDLKVQDFTDKLTSSLKEFLVGRINTLLKSIQNTKYKQVESYLTRIFSDLKPNFWDEFVTEFNKIFDNYEDEIFSLRQGKNIKILENF